MESVSAGLGFETVMIGAMAYRVWIPGSHRLTYDVDAAVAIDLDDLPALTGLLRREAGTQDARREHRWLTAQGARVDLIPAGPRLRQQGHLQWPVSGTRMSLAGFEHVFAGAVLREVAPGVNVRVIPPPVLVLLKIVAYLENPYERQKDVGDLASLLALYEPGDERRFGDDILDLGLEYGEVPAYLVSRDLASLCSPEEAALVAVFLGQLNNEESRAFQLFTRAAPELEEEREPKSRMLIRAFSSGVETAT